MKKKEGFQAQHLYRFSQKHISDLSRDGLTKNLYLTNIGYFPQAQDHFVKRDGGAPDAICILCISGKGFCRIGNESVTLTPNEAIIIPPDIRHSYGADSDRKHNWGIYWFHFNGSSLNEILPILSAGKIAIQQSRLEKWILAFDDMLFHLNQAYSTEDLKRISLQTWGLLSELLYPEPEEKGMEISVVQQARNWIHDNLHSSIRLADLCQAVHMSPSRLSERFKAETGMSPIEYVQKQRIDRACALIEHTNQPVKAIASSVGYDDPNHFSRTFKKLTGYAPVQFKNRASGDRMIPGRIINYISSPKTFFTRIPTPKEMAETPRLINVISKNLLRNGVSLATDI